MSWADRAITELQAGKIAVVIPHGNSMRPKVAGGARVTLEPVAVGDVVAGDIVLCRVKGNVYLHLAKATRGSGTDQTVLIGNNRGGTNGWTQAIYGRAVTVENP